MWHNRKRSKYGAIPVVINGIRFASKREGARYWELLLMEKGLKIRNLTLQPNFKFPCGTSYRADFAYEENGKSVVEDIKGFSTPVFRIKARCFGFHYPNIEFRITR